MALINEILDLASIEAGKMPLCVEQLALGNIADWAIRGFAQSAENEGLVLDVEIAEDAPSSIETDEGRLRQIIKNFLSNAMKFTSQGQVTLRINRHVPSGENAGTRDDVERIEISVQIQELAISPDKLNSFSGLSTG